MGWRRTVLLFGWRCKLPGVPDRLQRVVAVAGDKEAWRGVLAPSEKYDGTQRVNAAIRMDPIRETCLRGAPRAVGSEDAHGSSCKAEVRQEERPQLP